MTDQLNIQRLQMLSDDDWQGFRKECNDSLEFQVYILFQRVRELELKTMNLKKSPPMDSTGVLPLDDNDM